MCVYVLCLLADFILTRQRGGTGRSHHVVRVCIGAVSDYVGAGKSSSALRGVVRVAVSIGNFLSGICAQPCCCVDLPNRSSLGSGWETMNPPSPAAHQIQLSLMEDPGNTVMLTPLVPQILTFVLMEQQLVFFLNASITKQTQSPERPYTIRTSASNLIYLEQGRAVSQLGSQMIICPTSPIFIVVLQQ